VQVESSPSKSEVLPPSYQFADLDDEDDETVLCAPAVPSSSPAAVQPGSCDDEPTQAAHAVPELDNGEAEARDRVRLEPVDTTEAAADDQPRRGRGRRRRGRGRGERRPGEEHDAAAPRATLPDGAAATTTEAIARGPELPVLADAQEEEGPDEKEGDEPEGGEQPGRRKRRRRRRRRKPEDGTAIVGPAVEPAVAAETAAEKLIARPAIADEIEDDRDEDEGDQDEQPRSNGEDDEPEEDFSDWNVPSWNELIAALYRPDR
jgi:hypothetical protein